MNKMMTSIVAATIVLMSATPALAGHGHHWPSSSGGWSSTGGNTSTGGWSSTGGNTSTGGTNTSSGGTTSSSSGGATSVPEPTDAVLLLMGAAGVVIGRRLHAKKKQG